MPESGEDLARGHDNVLDSQRALFASQRDLAQREATVATDVVALYKALGGGWESLVSAP